MPVGSGTVVTLFISSRSPIVIANRPYCLASGAALTPCSRMLSAIVMTVTDRISALCVASDFSRISSTNRIDASPRGPNPPKSSTLGSLNREPASDSAISSMRIRVRLSSA